MAFITAVNFCARAELKDTVEGGVIHPAVSFQTNALSGRELEAILGVKAYHFNVHRTSLTNGLAVYVEINMEGKAPTAIAHLELDRATFDNERAGVDIPVLVAINPVGSFDGEGLYSAKKLRGFLREAGVTTAGTADNPFYKNKNGIASWSFDPAHESATIYKLMEGNSGTNSSSPKIEIRVRFHEF